MEVGAGDVGVEKVVVEEVGAEEEVDVGAEVGEAGEEVKLHRHDSQLSYLIETASNNVIFHLILSIDKKSSE